MDDVLVYELNGHYLSEREDLLKDTLNKWLKNFGYDVLITSFCFEDMGNLNIDCEDQADKMDDIKKKTEMLLKRLNIGYSFMG